MTTKDKQILLQDLCARLPYGVKVDINFFDDTKELNCSLLQDCIVSEKSLKPYLHPMSNMTEDDEATKCAFLDNIEGGVEDSIPKYVDWLNASHFDYRGLIEKGLALEAPEGMYEVN